MQEEDEIVDWLVEWWDGEMDDVVKGKPLPTDGNRKQAEKEKAKKLSAGEAKEELKALAEKDEAAGAAQSHSLDGEGNDGVRSRSGHVGWAGRRWRQSVRREPCSPPRPSHGAPAP